MLRRKTPHESPEPPQSPGRQSCVPTLTTFISATRNPCPLRGSPLTTSHRSRLLTLFRSARGGLFPIPLHLLPFLLPVRSSTMLGTCLHMCVTVTPKQKAKSLLCVMQCLMSTLVCPTYFFPPPLCVTTPNTRSCSLTQRMYCNSGVTHSAQGIIKVTQFTYLSCTCCDTPYRTQMLIARRWAQLIQTHTSHTQVTRSPRNLTKRCTVRLSIPASQHQRRRNTDCSTLHAQLTATFRAQLYRVQLKGMGYCRQAEIKGLISGGRRQWSRHVPGMT